MIPEHVPVVTSVTGGRPEELAPPAGRFLFRHIKRSGFFGFWEIAIAPDPRVRIATPEKALADLLYLPPPAATKLTIWRSCAWSVRKDLIKRRRWKSPGKCDPIKSSGRSPVCITFGKRWPPMKPLLIIQLPPKKVRWGGWRVGWRSGVPS